MTLPLKTARLHLEPLSIQDADAIQALFPKWEIVRYMTDSVPWPYPPDGAIRFIRDHALPAIHREEAWHWTLRPAAKPDRIIGAICLMKGEENNRGFWLDPVWQGQGVMMEAPHVSGRLPMEIWEITSQEWKEWSQRRDAAGNEAAHFPPEGP